jgi:hypothetical protein
MRSQSIKENRGSNGVRTAQATFESDWQRVVRSWHGLPTLPYLGQQLAYIRDDPNLEFV